MAASAACARGLGNGRGRGLSALLSGARVQPVAPRKDPKAGRPAASGVAAPSARMAQRADGDAEGGREVQALPWGAAPGEPRSSRRVPIPSGVVLRAATKERRGSSVSRERAAPV